MYSQEAITPYSPDAEGKREQVEEMFNNISSTYDTLNATLSLGIDRRWRKTLIGTLQAYFPKQAPLRVLDVATGTADLSVMAAEAFPQAQVVGVDISDRMMDIGRYKVARHGLTARVNLQHADCTDMPYADGSFDAVISSFGLRNFQHLDLAYAEMRRVLREGGKMVVIDLCAPRRFPMKQVFGIYKRVLMPLAGLLISHDRKAYSYLPATMDAIPQGEDMVSILRKAGWRNVAYQRLVFGMCMLYRAEK